MPPKKHFKTLSQEVPSQLLLNYLQSKEHLKGQQGPQFHFSEETSKVKQVKNKFNPQSFSPSHKDEVGNPTNFSRAINQNTPSQNNIGQSPGGMKNTGSVGQRQIEAMVLGQLSKRSSQQGIQYKNQSNVSQQLYQSQSQQHNNNNLKQPYVQVDRSREVEQYATHQFSKILSSFISPKQGNQKPNSQSTLNINQNSGIIPIQNNIQSKKPNRPGSNQQSSHQIGINQSNSYNQPQQQNNVLAYQQAQPTQMKGSHVKTQPHSQQNSITKVPKMVEDLQKETQASLIKKQSEIPQSATRFLSSTTSSNNPQKQQLTTDRTLKQPQQKFNQRKNSEETGIKNEQPTLKNVKSFDQLIPQALGLHQKSLSGILINQSTKSSSQQENQWFAKIKNEQQLQKNTQTINSNVLSTNRTIQVKNNQISIILHYRGGRQKYMIDPTKNNIAWLLDFINKELHNLDNSLRGHFVGIRTHNTSVPVDYLLSRKSLPLIVLFEYSQQLIIEPIMCLIPREQQLRQKATLRDFDFIRCIGHGGFSQVYLVREKCSGEFYAMKLVQKKPIQLQGKQSIIQNERDIMAHLDHPFIVKMHYAFESKKYLVFVLEYCSGGELFYLLRKVKRMSEEEAFFYFAEICLGMKHLHDNNIVYRDIKPENILIDFEGHVRIADFGLSKPHMEAQDVAYSFCGSPEYMAPEMLLKSGHNFQLDLYCLGALLFELITGLPPYYSRDTDEIYNRILNQKLTFPTSINLSTQVKDILNVLLAKNPKRRISGIRQLLQHPWMLKWGGQELINKIENKQVAPPYSPDPYHFNFDEEEFGQGETEFLAEVRILQEQSSENAPRETLLTSFYYSKDAHMYVNSNIKRIKEGTGGTESLHGQTSEQENIQKMLSNLQIPEGNRNQNKQKTQITKGISSRINTLDDFFDIKGTPEQGGMNQFRLQTEK